MPHRFRITPVLGGLALVLATLAVAFSATGVSFGDGRLRTSTEPDPGAVLRLEADKQFTPDALPTVRKAVRTSQVGRFTEDGARSSCPGSAADLGTWCLDRGVRGVSDYGGASRLCRALRGYLPSAAELVGAAPRVQLSGRLDDKPDLALMDPARRRDLREMSATTFTTSTGSAAAGAFTNALPATLQVVTVYDNRDRGGFAGGSPVGAPARFRCAYLKRQQGPAAAPKLTLGAATASAGRRIDVPVHAPLGGDVAVVATVRAGKSTIVVARGTWRAKAAGDGRVRLRATTVGRKRLRPGRTQRLTFRAVLRPRTGAVLSASAAPAPVALP